MAAWRSPRLSATWVRQNACTDSCARWTPLNDARPRLTRCTTDDSRLLVTSYGSMRLHAAGGPRSLTRCLSSLALLLVLVGLSACAEIPKGRYGIERLKFHGMK